MTFAHHDFWIFFILVFSGYLLIQNQRELKSPYLVISSFLFYYLNSGFFFLLLALSTLCMYFIAIAIHKSVSPLKRKLFLVLGVWINGLLFLYYKCAYFFADILNKVFGTHFTVSDHLDAFFNYALGIHGISSKIIAPVGITFIVLHEISYLFDVYKHRLHPVTNLFDFSLYVSFFPQLIAGPIVRAPNFIPQIDKPNPLSSENVGSALLMVSKGLAKTILIANFIAKHLVGNVFKNPDNFTGPENVLAITMLPLEIYCEFSGYSDIAIGIALLFGFQLPNNFNAPFRARTIEDLWRRWHISFCSWVRDYIYIPLGGNRVGPILSALNILLVIVFSALWHGASWNFLFWGGINGVGLISYKIWKKFSPLTGIESWPAQAYGMTLTYLYFAFGGVWFGTATIQTANTMLSRIVGAVDLQIWKNGIAEHRGVLIVFVMGLATHLCPSYIKGAIYRSLTRGNITVNIGLTIFIAWMVYLSQPQGASPFLYGLN